MLLLLGSILFYSGYLLIELRSYLLVHALFVDLERERKNQYLVHGVLYYGALLYQQHKAAWHLPHTFSYLSVTGERITLVYTQISSQCVEIRAVFDTHNKITGCCRIHEYTHEYTEPEFELEFKK